MTNDDHERMRLIRARVNAGKPMSAIAAEIGEDLDDLVKWIMTYKEPKRKPYVNRSTEPVYVSNEVYRPDTFNSRRFAAWRKAKEGAAAARKAIAE